jgi:hypothetical protein
MSDKNSRERFVWCIENDFFHDNPNYSDTKEEAQNFLKAYDKLAKERDNLLAQVIELEELLSE